MGSARFLYSRLLLLSMMSLLMISCQNEPDADNLNTQPPASEIESSDDSVSNSPGDSPSDSNEDGGQQLETESDSPLSEDITPADASPTISPNETPETVPLQLVSQGYTQADRQIAYAFVVENLNQETAVADSKYEVTAYDSTGVNLASDSEFLTILLPNQQLGISGNLFLEQSTPAALITVRLETGQPLFDFSETGLDINQIRYWPGQRYDRVTAIVSNDGLADLEEIRLAAIAYDSQGAIIGGGHSLLNFLLSGRETGVDITLDVAGEIDHVELFARVSPSSLLSSDEQIQIFGNRISLLDSGFSQLDIEFSYGFLFVNRHLSFAVQDSPYRLTAFNDEGYVIAIDEGQIDLILPGQTLGLGRSLFIENDESVDRIDLVIQDGPAVLAPAQPLFEIQDLVIAEVDGATDLTGQLLNPFERDLENISLYVLFFDQDGVIIGGSSENLNMLPAASSVSVDLKIPPAVSPETAQLFANVSALNDLE